MFKQMSLARQVLVTATIAVFLSACSAMLVGGGTSGGQAIGEDNRSSAQIRTDNALAAAVRNAFSADSSLRSRNLTVSSRNGVVMLGGVVGSFDARDDAVRIAADIEGVSRVDNQLQVNTRHKRY